MTRNLLPAKSLPKIALILLVAFAFPDHSRALIKKEQKKTTDEDFVIMVAGPWQFVKAKDPGSLQNGKPTERLFLIAPSDPKKAHVAYYWSGTDASVTNWLHSKGTPTDAYGVSAMVSSAANVYRVDFPQDNKNVKFQKAAEREREITYHAKADQNTIKSVLFSGTVQRFALSLPKPDYARTYSGPFGPGAAESKIGKKNDPTMKDHWTSYATWTELHYEFEEKKSPKEMKVKHGDQSDTIHTMVDKQPNGISIFLAAAPLCDPNDTTKGYYPDMCPSNFPSDPEWIDGAKCDTLSQSTFAMTANLWHLQEQARFPVEPADEKLKRPIGFQISGYYDYACKPASAATMDIIENDLRLRADLTDLSRLLNLPFPIPTKEEARNEKKRDTKDVEKHETQIDQNLFATTLSNIEEDFKLLNQFNGGIKTNLECIREKANQTDESSGTLESCVRALDDALTALDGGGKNMSDCHASQVSINKAIESKR